MHSGQKSINVKHIYKDFRQIQPQTDILKEKSLNVVAFVYAVIL